MAIESNIIDARASKGMELDRRKIESVKSDFTEMREAALPVFKFHLWIKSAG